MKRFIRCMIILMLIMNNANVFTQEDEDDNIPYLSDEDIAAIEIVLPEDPVEIPEIAAENTTAQDSEVSRPNPSGPVYHLLILDRRSSPLNSGISVAGDITVLYQFKHGSNGFLIAVYISRDESRVFPVLPDNSRIIVDVASTYKSSLRDYVNSSAFRRYVTSRKITTALQAALYEMKK